MGTLKFIHPEKFSGFFPKHCKKAIERIKRQSFIVLPDFSVGGDAPKDFIKLYQYGRVRRKNAKNWIGYIAKVGHKWYPNESITEFLMSCIGNSLGLKMANSKLTIISGQIRFLSEYFLISNYHELIHGADIFANYIADRDLVEEIENSKLAREFFSFQFTCKAIETVFSENSDLIIRDFVKLLMFDAIIGNNDRHFYNWGVIRSIDGRNQPCFSPIYDTARGLFWNRSEKKLSEIRTQKQDAVYLQNYVNKCLPKIGWDGEKDLNHFELIAKIKKNYPIYKDIIDELVTEEKEEKVLIALKKQLSGLFTVNRLHFITECLKLRFNKLRTC